ncbi:MAG: hypothetical protein AAF772_14775 [Acidobacteriota bacterium]
MADSHDDVPAASTASADGAAALRAPRRLFATLVLAAAIAVALGAWLAPHLYRDELNLADDDTGAGVPATAHARDADWTGSPTCAACHPDQHASWARTFHRTMTQEADRTAVVGRFDGTPVRHDGIVATPRRDGDRYLIELRGSGIAETFEVVRTVGSRRYQQYLAYMPGRGENLYRLPILWHIEDQRWVHMNGVFLGRDGEGYFQHLAVWNQNCIFCHNTGPVPNIVNHAELIARGQRGEPVDSARDARYDSHVAELGIACESCHGPGGAHAARNRNPLRRYAMHFTDGADPTIVDPARLDAQRSVDVCGQCHGQRIAPTVDRLVAWIHDGPTYQAGARLAEHVRPVFRDTRAPIAHQDDLFSRRFWQDGTARLTAYEYQGILQSPCFEAGTLSCLSCHAMHGAEDAVDVRGQLPHAMRTNQGCVQCHETIGADVAAHTGHAVDSTGSQCYSCHMPKMVYGIMEIHRSHRIENPNAAANAAEARPHACTSCHLDRTLPWSAEASGALWGDSYGAPVAVRGDGADPAVIDSIASLLAGDPVQRAVAAHRMGRDDSPLAGGARAFLVPHLIESLTDPYPAIRRFASRSLRAIDADMAAASLDLSLTATLDDFDFMGPEAQRAAVIERLRARWSAFPKTGLPAPPAGALLAADYVLDAEAERALRALGLAQAKQIHIGE